MIEAAPVAEVKRGEEAPALAHLLDPSRGPDPVGLCGKRLIGVPAPYDAQCCAVCEALWVSALDVC